MRTILLALAVLCLAATAQAQQQRIYECVRPDGTVVCTVADTSGDPSVTCNYECVDCNMVCTARMRLMEDKAGQGVPVTPPAVKGERRKSAGGQPETREYCRQGYQECMAKCKADPKNKRKYDMDACVSSCNSWLSGCGMGGQ